MAFAVTVWPLIVSVAFHDPVMACPEGSVNVTVQPLIAELPAVTVAGCTTYPVCHWVCTVPAAEQAPPVAGRVVVGGGPLLVLGGVVGGRLVVALVVVGGGLVWPL